MGWVWERRTNRQTGDTSTVYRKPIGVHAFQTLHRRMDAQGWTEVRQFYLDHAGAIDGIETRLSDQNESTIFRSTTQCLKKRKDGLVLLTMQRLQLRHGN